jgi:hypothetical protein
MRVAYSVPEQHKLVAQSWYPRRWSCLERVHPVLRKAQDRWNNINLDPAEIRVFLKDFFNDFPRKKKKHSTVGRRASPAACAIGFYVSLDAQKRFKKKKKNSDLA